MGASESTTKSNGTKEEEEEERQQRPAGASIAAAVAGVAAVGVAAWGISRMLSDDTDGQQKQDAMTFRAEPSSFGSSNSSRLQGTHDQPYPTSNTRSGRFKMETSGACHSEPGPGVNLGPSGYGGILRDGRGNWVKGFLGFIGENDALTTEFHGILKGLQLLDKLGHVGSILESDHEPAVDWINNKTRLHPSRSQVIEDCWDIIQKCKNLKEKNNIKVIYCSNDNNSAKKLADIAIYEKGSYAEIINLNDNNTTTQYRQSKVLWR